MKEPDYLQMWIDGEEGRIQRLSAGSVGFRVAKLPANWMLMFFGSLSQNLDARRLLSKILPKCDKSMLAGFVMLAMRPEVELELLRLTKDRGTRFKAWGRSYARYALKASDQSRASFGREVLRRANSVDKLSAVLWRHRRLISMEAAELKRSKETAPLVEDVLSGKGPDMPVLDRFVRYETAFERTVDRILCQLEKLQKVRRGRSVPPEQQSEL
jgi:hypothetical protein